VHVLLLVIVPICMIMLLVIIRFVVTVGGFLEREFMLVDFLVLRAMRVGQADLERMALTDVR
jgi:hypothetical protein